MNKTILFQILGLTAMTLVSLTGCVRDEGDLTRYIAEVKERPATPIAPIPPVRTYTPYKYEGLTGRDPFRQSTSEGSDEVAQDTTKRDGPRPDFKRTKEYLERFELDTMVMVGTFDKEQSNWGLIQDPNGVIHRIEVGNYLGKNHGKVSAVRTKEVRLSEFIADGTGGWVVRDASMALGGS